MRKQEFMDAMRSRLSAIGKSPQDTADILADFEEHIAAGIAGGRTEEDVVAGIGDPAELAAQYADGSEPPRTPSSDPSPSKTAVTAAGIGRGFFAAIALLFFDLLIGLPILAALFSVLLSLWVAALSIGIAGIAVIVSSIFFLPLIIPFNIPGVILVFVGIALLALTVPACIGMYYLSKLFVRGVKEYLVAHAKIVKGGSRP
jgi:uncharacterized membrane protein